MAKNYKKVSILFSVWFRVSLVLVLFGVGLVLPLWAEAAVLYLEPSGGEYYPGDTFIINVRIDTKECVNSVKADISFPPDVLEVLDFSRGNSILTIWIKNETGSDRVSFAGGIPGGYCGIVPGDPGESNLLGKIIFRVIPREVPRSSAQVVFTDASQVLLNDGLGTPAKLTARGATIKITGVEPLQISRDEWQEELAKDKTPPESFEIDFGRDPDIFSGKYFIIFNAQDKQTGIDYYEVKEGKRDWKRITSPYVLADQSLGGAIQVKAVDKAGNERIVQYLPSKPFPYGIIILILVAAGAIWWSIKKFII